MEANSFDVVKHVQQVRLDRVGITRLSQDLQQRWIGHEEEAREKQALLLQVAVVKTTKLHKIKAP